MLESSEEQLSHDIARTLRFDTLITPEQQRQAKERLLAVASVQTRLSACPPAVESSDSPLRRRLGRLSQQIRYLLALLITESSAYERAHQPRHPIPYYNIYRRQVFGVVFISA